MASKDSSPRASSIPPDDMSRELGVARPETDPQLPHISIAGGTYTILLSGEQTGGRYCLVDMLVPPTGGPPAHRHDFEEMFYVIDGEIELTIRGKQFTARRGETVNIPANAPHSFRNRADGPARLLCMCTPPGQELYFLEVGDPVASRIAPPPMLSEAEQEARKVKAQQLASKYRTEFV